MSNVIPASATLQLTPLFTAYHLHASLTRPTNSRKKALILEVRKNKNQFSHQWSEKERDKQALMDPHKKLARSSRSSAASSQSAETVTGGVTLPETLPARTAVDLTFCDMGEQDITTESDSDDPTYRPGSRRLLRDLQRFPGRIHLPEGREGIFLGKYKPTPSPSAASASEAEKLPSVPATPSDNGAVKGSDGSCHPYQSHCTVLIIELTY